MRLGIALLLALGLIAAPARAAGLSRHVDPMIGTFAPGFVVPGASTPFGMVQNSPDTRGEFAYAGYVYHDPTIHAFSLVHLSGPGVKKGGDAGFMPFVGEQRPPTAFDHMRETARAGAYEVTLANGIRVELAAARRAALQRYTFPAGTTDARVLFDLGSNETREAETSLEIGATEVAGYRRGRYPVYWVARFDRPIARKGADWAGFDATTVTVRVGLSFVDHDGARRNLEAEAPDFDVAAMQARAARAWDRELARVRVTGGTVLDKRSFYTALYHAYLHPNVFEDVDGRYRGADDRIHDSGARTHYANFSSWDTYKAQNQLLALTQPARYRDMLRSLLATAREAGRLPRWGEWSIDASHMSGDPAVPMIADGYCRGLLDGETARALYDAGAGLRSHRPAELDALGYLPDRPGTTLEYGIADFALALMADGLGHDDEAARWLKASLNYRNILDPQTRFIRPRKADGTWHSPFFTAIDETGFQEGNSWQYSWLAPHDARGLFDRMGGDAEVRRRMQTFFALPPEAQTRATFFGIVYRLPQYAPGNEHDLQAPWMPVFAGQPWKAAEVLAGVRTLFRPTVDGLPGNDDLGGLSAWHVFSAIGFGPVTPGAPFYVIGSPQFERITIRLPGKRRLVVDAPGASPVNRYVTGARLGGAALDRAWLFERDLVRAGRLELTVSPLADRAWATEDRPPSASDAKLRDFGCRGA